MARRTRAVVLPFALAACAALAVVLGASQAFVPSPNNATALRGAYAGAAAALLPLAAHADLPPLEDLDVTELNPDRERSTGMQFLIFDETNAAYYGVVVVGAIVWALLWVNLLKPAKDEAGEYKTYLGGGALPPEGYTNPLDPRMQTEEDAGDVYEAARDNRKKAKAEKAGGGGGSAVV
mmetsp:Transcript_46563/g.110742  ORF Transcript_46563/g.110742 Transcript_46563/m.110742 type:complete len:179 (-) Transcript_46563:67-603(-)